MLGLVWLLGNIERNKTDQKKKKSLLSWGLHFSWEKERRHFIYASSTVSAGKLQASMEERWLKDTLRTLPYFKNHFMPSTIFVLLTLSLSSHSPHFEFMKPFELWVCRCVWKRKKGLICSWFNMIPNISIAFVNRNPKASKTAHFKPLPQN